MRELAKLSKSFREPAPEPGKHCYVIMQDHGPEGGGWGPSAVQLPWATEPMLFVYTREDEKVLALIEELVPGFALKTGKKTRLVRYSAPETVVGY